MTMLQLCSENLRLPITAKQIPQHSIQCLSRFGCMLSFQQYLSLHLFLPLSHNIFPSSGILSTPVSAIVDDAFTLLMCSTIHSSFKAQLKCLLFYDSIHNISSCNRSLWSLCSYCTPTAILQDIQWQKCLHYVFLNHVSLCASHRDSRQIAQKPQVSICEPMKDIIK